MRRSDRSAFAIAWPVFFTVVFLSWRKVTSAPNGDITGLVVATACGTFGLVLLAVWLQEREDRRALDRRRAAERHVRVRLEDLLDDDVAGHASQDDLAGAGR